MLIFFLGMLYYGANQEESMAQPATLVKSGEYIAGSTACSEDSVRYQKEFHSLCEIDRTSRCIQ
ncbi:hypothetical protein C7460_11632 [Marinoscillum furvescens DSM 4134]|uniref:Uncharacterized protein n=2 Tax=Marinoscillum furvescens TaxID=1026 RepID=A0A3D9KZX8_MARFU|nr:hypothetical protein C7460_11632 [Marinoscillum furvescens DSM 4134]